MTLLSYIDQPASWDAIPPCVIVRGWCFGAEGQPIAGIRLLFFGHILNGVVGLQRPDVKAALPAAPGEDTGFEIRGTLPARCGQLTIEARLTDGPWRPIFTHTVKIARRWRPLWAGGGTCTEMIYFQMPAHMAYPPRAVISEKFPAPRARAAWPKFSIVTPS